MYELLIHITKLGDLSKEAPIRKHVATIQIEGPQDFVRECANRVADAMDQLT